MANVDLVENFNIIEDMYNNIEDKENFEIESSLGSLVNKLLIIGTLTDEQTELEDKVYLLSKKLNSLSSEALLTELEDILSYKDLV